MADSNITKRALANALRDLMEELPFDKIQISHICERCNMNRKSFYYHFKDKYDLVNWIFDTEFVMLAKESMDELSYDDRWKLIERACEYFYENRLFYRSALKIKGQNSFSDHLREYCQPMLKTRIAYLIDDRSMDDFVINFFSDALMCAIERWLLDKECIPPEQFVAKIKHLIQSSASTLCKEMQTP